MTSKDMKKFMEIFENQEQNVSNFLPEDVVASIDYDDIYHYVEKWVRQTRLITWTRRPSEWYDIHMKARKKLIGEYLSMYVNNSFGVEEQSDSLLASLTIEWSELWNHEPRGAFIQFDKKPKRDIIILNINSPAETPFGYDYQDQEFLIDTAGHNFIAYACRLV